MKMNQHHYFWGFKNKDQRRLENDQDRQQQERCEKERGVEIGAHTHLDLYGRKGFVGLARSMPAFFRHTGNLIYARWVRGKIRTG
jgi:hypothetical protein